MYKLIISIVPHNCGELITDAANKAGAGGGTILMGRGTAENSVLQLLGLGDTSKDITFSLVDETIYSDALDKILEATSAKKAHFGVLFTIDINNFLKMGTDFNKTDTSKEVNPMTDENSYQLIHIIVNKGYAEDAMAVARKAGAGGGTIISARGTAKETDAEFFGAKIVPEKDMLLILVPQNKKDDVIKAVQDLPCLSEAGSGIVFTSKADDFTLLGKK